MRTRKGVSHGHQWSQRRAFHTNWFEQEVGHCVAVRLAVNVLHYEPGEPEAGAGVRIDLTLTGKENLVFPGPDHVAERGVRSEERRVGKECRSRWSPYH